MTEYNLSLPNRNERVINFPIKNIVGLIPQKEFIKHLRRRSYSEARIYKYQVMLRKMSKHNITPLCVTPRQVDKFFFYLQNNGFTDETKRDYWVLFKRIVKFYNPRMAWLFRQYRIKVRPQKINILTKEELQLMIDNANSFRNRVLLEVLYEAGLRIGELMNISRGDVTFDKHGALILVNGKTGVRRVRVIHSAMGLKKLLEKKPKPFAVSRQYIENKIIKKMARRAGITKRVYPMLFRHTRATHLAKHLTDRELCFFFGWSKDSKMPYKYVHLSGRDLDDKIISISFQS